MGNHEFCEECGESNFHLNRPCNPERKTKFEAEQKENHERYEASLKTKD